MAASLPLPSGYNYRILTEQIGLVLDRPLARRVSQYLAHVPVGLGLRSQAVLYELSTPEGQPVAVLGRLPEGRAWVPQGENRDPTLSLRGVLNVNPYPDHGRAIRELGSVLQLDLSAENAAPHWRAWERGLTVPLEYDRAPIPVPNDIAAYRAPEPLLAPAVLTAAWNTVPLPGAYSARRLKPEHQAEILERSEHTSLAHYLGRPLYRDAAFFELRTPSEGYAALLGILPEGRYWASQMPNENRSLFLAGKAAEDPYAAHGAAIEALGQALGLDLAPQRAAPFWELWENERAGQPLRNNCELRMQ